MLKNSIDLPSELYSFTFERFLQLRVCRGQNYPKTCTETEARIIILKRSRTINKICIFLKKKRVIAAVFLANYIQ